MVMSTPAAVDLSLDDTMGVDSAGAGLAGSASLGPVPGGFGLTRFGFGRTGLKERVEARLSLTKVFSDGPDPMCDDVARHRTEMLE